MPPIHTSGSDLHRFPEPLSRESPQRGSLTSKSAHDPNTIYTIEQTSFNENFRRVRA